ncbi:MAG: iron-containing alcohol dehydrogenase [Actinomycetota bacterium]|nr:iron-containing alcohol dehydrogenase [Actinomycetota bacterium]
MLAEPFTFADGERLIRFGGGALADAPELLAERGFDGYALLTTQRAMGSGAALGEGAASVLDVPEGPVPEAAAAVRDGVEGRPLVALGGGRVIDAAKAVAAAERLECATVPTTLAGSPFTPFHRLPAGVSDSRPVRPSLVIADPALMASLPRPRLVATALNALAHAMESLYGPRANPVAELAALRAAELFASALPRDDPPADDVALASLLGGYAIGVTGLAVHHAVCQTIVRTCGTPHAETNAVMLPHSAGLAAGRAPRALGAFAKALGDPAGDPAAAGERVAALTGLTGVTRLSDLGVGPESFEELTGAVMEHPALQETPGRMSSAEVAALLQTAL